MDFTNQSPTVLSFCPGILGLERGLRRAIGHVRTLCYVEIEAFICENLACQMESGVLDPAPLWSDLKTFPAEVFRGKVEGVTGGYPCTPFSLAGQRLGEMDERHLWPFIRNHVSAVGPLWCFFENVDDHLTMGFDNVYKDLRALGYLVEAGVYSAAECGAPHERQRIFILAVHDSGIQRFAQKYSLQAGRNTAFPPGAMADTTNGENNGREPGSRGRKGKTGEIFDATVDFGGDYVPDTEFHGSQGLDQTQEGPQPHAGPVRGELADPTEQGLPKSRSAGVAELRAQNGTGLDHRLELTGSPVADANIDGQPQQGRIIEKGRRRAIDGSKKMADADICWQQSGEPSGVGGIEEQFAWPAPPGPQYEWEPPRTVTREAESSMGISFDGYKFREDLLRALGNSVVEQQAELAWNDLVRKHCQDI